MSNSSPRYIAIDVSTSPYAWPGGYPRYAITDDGGCLCKKCCATELENITESYACDGWHIVASDVNWEDSQLTCDHCGELIECAYGDE